MIRPLKTSEFLQLLSRKCDEAGGVTAFAALHGLPHSVVSETLAAKREASEAVCNAAGCIRATVYRVVRP